MNGVCSSCVAPPASLECAVLDRPDPNAPAECTERLSEEIADFIARRVLEPDAQFFDG